MALFGGIRDARFLAAVNSELLNSIIDTEIEFFKLIVESSNSNIYGESESKAFNDSILIPCLITKETKTAKRHKEGGGERVIGIYEIDSSGVVGVRERA